MLKLKKLLPFPGSLMHGGKEVGSGEEGYYHQLVGEPLVSEFNAIPVLLYCTCKCVCAAWRVRE